MLACARIGAPHSVVFGGFSADALRTRIDDAEAKLVITADGGYRRGKRPPPSSPPSTPPSPVTATGREGPRGQAHRHGRRRGHDDRDVLVARRRSRRPRDEHEAAGHRRRAPAVHPLHLRHHREAQGHLPHHRRLPDPGGLHQLGRPRPPPRDRRLLVHRRHRLGHRPLLHRLRAAGQRRDAGHLRGHPGHPAPGPLVGDHREVQGLHPLHRAHRDPHLHEVGRGHPRQVRPVLAARARLGR